MIATTTTTSFYYSILFAILALQMMVGPLLAYNIKPGGGYGNVGENVKAYTDAVDAILPKITASPPILAPLPQQDDEADPGPPDYWFHSKIHTFGNTGFFGGFHAACAPIATAIIDAFAYSGENIRNLIARDLVADFQRRTMNNNNKLRIIDLCCGVGMSTRALHDAVQGKQHQHQQQNQEVDIIGLDTSPEMLAMANLLSNQNGYTTTKKTTTTTSTSSSAATSSSPASVTMKEGRKNAVSLQYVNGNAENTKQPHGTFDLVTIMYGFHEIPKGGRQRILNEAYKLLRSGGTLAIIDICPTYEPSYTMLAGEPYVLEYQSNIKKQLNTAKGFQRPKFRNVVPGHVCLWQLTKKTG